MVHAKPLDGQPGRGSKPVGRLAPSPTGGLHVGHARTFLVAWLMVRTAGGRLIFRVEDLDAERVRPGMAEAAVADLRWLGLDWDEGPDIGGPNAPYEQSRRLDRYETALEALIRAEAVYPCTCTRADIARAASAPHAEDEGPTYSGTCSGRSAGDAEGLRRAGRPFAWRFRIGADEIGWVDQFRCPCRLDPARLGGDFVVGRSVGGPSYQLAVVVDDAMMGVDQVVRGDDLLPSTPRQILIAGALGLESPSYAHLPLVIGPDGRRLAKRDRSLKLSTLRESGLPGDRIVGRIAFGCGWRADHRPTAPRDLIGRVDPLAIPREPWRVDLAGLA